MAADRSQEDKLALLDLARKTGNVSAACKTLGFSRDSYYRIKKAYDAQGADGLKNRRVRTPHPGGRIPPEVEAVIVSISLADPGLGKHRVSRRLAARGIHVSPSGVRNVWDRNGLTTQAARETARREGLRPPRKDTPNHLRAVSSQNARKDPIDREPIDFINITLRQRLSFEALISQLSALFINLPVDRIDAEIKNGQQRVCKFLGLHRSLFVEFRENRDILLPTHLWYADHVTANFPRALTAEWRYFTTRFLKGETILISDVATLSEAQVGKSAKKYLQKIGVTSIAGFPFTVGRRVIGAISWESYGIRKEWTDDLVDRLRLVSEVFANALSRKRTEETLRQSLEENERLNARLKADNVYLMDEIRVEHDHHRIVGKSIAIVNVLSQVEKVAATSSTVLLLGETGTGKELLAHAIHSLSRRNDRPMLKVNCAALPDALIESELFGHEKGAFSGAVSKKPGRFEAAHESSLFLDEIGDLPLVLQPKLLRVLQEGQFERLGSVETMDVDVRVIAATNQDLEKSAAEGRFRRDLYYRLNIFPITIPPLRERKEDIPLLVSAFVKTFSERMAKTIENVASESIEAMQRYDWPGNVRELQNLVERAMILAKGKTLRIQLPEKDWVPQRSIETLDEVNRKHILNALAHCGWRVAGPKGAAALLGVYPSTLRSRMQRLGIQREKRYR